MLTVGLVSSVSAPEGNYGVPRPLISESAWCDLKVARSSEFLSLSPSRPRGSTFASVLVCETSHQPQSRIEIIQRAGKAMLKPASRVSAEGLGSFCHLFAARGHSLSLSDDSLTCCYLLINLA